MTAWEAPSLGDDRHSWTDLDPFRWLV